MGKYIVVSNTDELYHHGIKGQRWGVRRFQNEDGSLTPAGVKRYQPDAYGNMTKKGAANYYRDLYNEAKAIGYRGQGVHDYVKQHFNSEGDYQAFVENYRKYKAKKAVKGVAAGAAGIAAVTALTAGAAGASAYGLGKLGKRMKDDAIVGINNKYYGGKRMQGMSAEELIKLANFDPKQASTKALVKEARIGTKAAEILARRKMEQDTKAQKKYVKNNNLVGDELREMISNTATKSLNATTNNKLEKEYSKALAKRSDILRKAYTKQIRKEYGNTIKDAALEQARIETGKSAVQNRMNTFSNSLFGQIASGAGTTLGAMYVNAQVEASRRAISNMYDEETANRIAPGSLKIKEYKDKSSTLTMPQRMDKAWENALKGDSKPKTNNDDDDEGDDEEKKKRN